MLAYYSYNGEIALYLAFRSANKSLSDYNFVVKVSAMSGVFVWAVILLGPTEVSTLQNSEVSAFQGVWLYVSLWRYIPDRAVSGLS